jgi:hypothetical protein
MLAAARIANTMASVRVRARRPAVIIASQSRHAKRNSCRANQTMVPGALMRRRRRLR